MHSSVQILLIGLIILLTHTLEGITGFGCTVLALPFLAMMLGIKQAVPVLVVLGWILVTYVVIVSRQNIRWKEYRYILLHVVIGLPFGVLMFRHLQGDYLKCLMALFMIWVGTTGWLQASKKEMEQNLLKTTNHKTWAMSLVLFLGGIIHGAFASGGPFVVIYASKALPDKSLFRVSLCLLWTTISTIMILQYTYWGDVWTPEIARIILCALPFLIAGMILGDYLHHRVDERRFRLIVYAALFLCGSFQLYDSIRGLSLS